MTDNEQKCLDILNEVGVYLDKAAPTACFVVVLSDDGMHTGWSFNGDNVDRLVGRATRSLAVMVERANEADEPEEPCIGRGLYETSENLRRR